MKGNYISTERVIEKALRVLPPFIDYNIEELVEYIYEAIKIIGGKNSAILKQLTLTLEENRCKIPSDVEDIISIKFDKVELDRVDRMNFMDYYSYTVINGYIYTTIGTGELDLIVSYYPIDDKGYPMIPEASYYERACIAYLSERLLYKLFLIGKVNANIYDLARKDWFYLCGNARAASLLPSQDEERVLAREVLKMFPNKLHRGIETQIRLNARIPKTDILNLNNLLLSQQPVGNLNDLTAEINREIIGNGTA